MITELFRTIDNKDAAGFAAYLASDCEFRFGNGSSVYGRDNIEQFVAGFFTSIAGLAHHLDDVWQVPDALICHGQVTYTRHDGSQLPVPFANVMKTSDAGITQYFIFADTSQLYG